jgi:glyoxylase-like metal-dependent hydrolase (beta-lactamase superfamily II)
MPFITAPQQLTKTVELLDVRGQQAPWSTGVVLVRGHEVAIVETGHTSCGARIMEELEKRAIPLEAVRYILVTHRHGDHCGGAAPLARALPNATVAGHKHAIATLRDPTRLNEGARKLFGRYTEEIQPLPPEAATRELQDRDVLDLGGGVRIEVIGAPGHTSDHLAYLEQRSGTLYTGDAAGLVGRQNHSVTPTSFPPSFQYAMYRSSLERLRERKPRIVAFAHAGAVTGSDVPLIFNRALSTLDEWRDVVETAWRASKSQNAVALAVRDRFLGELDAFPAEARSFFLQVLALGFLSSLFPDAT